MPYVTKKLRESNTKQKRVNAQLGLKNELMNARNILD